MAVYILSIGSGVISNNFCSNSLIKLFMDIILFKTFNAKL